MTPAIETVGLDKSFGTTRAVAGLDLSIRRGSVYGLLGPNGAGKTTTIRILATLLQHDLLDELSLVIHNVAAYSGARLFKDGGSLKRFDLIDVKSTRTGVIIATYQPRKP